jgi:hypothetical protein
MYQTETNTAAVLTTGAIGKLAVAAAEVRAMIAKTNADLADLEQRLEKQTGDIEKLVGERFTPFAENLAKWRADVDRRFDQAAADDANRFGRKVTADDMRRRREADEAIFAKARDIDSERDDDGKFPSQRRLTCFEKVAGRP